MSILINTNDPTQLEAFAKYLPLNPSTLKKSNLKFRIQDFCNKAKKHFEEMKKANEVMVTKVIDDQISAEELITFTDNFFKPALRVYSHCILVIHGYGHLSYLSAIDWKERFKEKTDHITCISDL